MAFIVSKKQQNLSEEVTVVVEVEDEREESEIPNTVTRHIYLKPSQNTSETLDKDQVRRRIRHRKRMNKFRDALQALLRSPFSSTSTEAQPDKVRVIHQSWLDDAFSAP